MILFFFIFVHLAWFPFIQAKLNFKCCHIYDVFIACGFYCASRTVKMFLLLFLLFEKFQIAAEIQSLRSHQTGYLVTDQFAGSPRCKISTQRCTSCPRDSSQQWLFPEIMKQSVTFASPASYFELGLKFMLFSPCSTDSPLFAIPSLPSFLSHCQEMNHSRL